MGSELQGWSLSSQARGSIGLARETNEVVGHMGFQLAGLYMKGAGGGDVC